MLVTLELATYLDRATRAINEGKIEIPLTNRCQECGEKIDTYHGAAGDDPHLVMQTTSDTYAVLVGCEGYWQINPALIGLPPGQWQDWTDNPLGDEAPPVCVLNAPEDSNDIQHPDWDRPVTMD